MRVGIRHKQRQKEQGKDQLYEIEKVNITKVRNIIEMIKKIKMEMGRTQLRMVHVKRRILTPLLVSMPTNWYSMVVITTKKKNGKP